jgi:hypothetical protein
MSDRISPQDPTSDDGRVRPNRLRRVAISCGCTALLLLGLTVAQNVRAGPNGTPGLADAPASATEPRSPDVARAGGSTGSIHPSAEQGLPASLHASGLPQDASDSMTRMRAIVADPAIRDFVGPAENAFDFARPDGVPGFGPMRATDDLDQLHAQATGRPAAPQPGEPPTPGVARAGQ